MAEPSTVAVVAGTGIVGIGGAALLPGVDLNAVVGAFGGAVLFVLWAKSLPIMVRLLYLFPCWIAGYFAGGEAVGRGWTQYSGLPALVGAAALILIITSALEWMTTGQTPTWIKTVWGWWREFRTGGSNG